MLKKFSKPFAVVCLLVALLVVFQKITGKTSYEWFRQKKDVYAMIQDQLQQYPDRLDLSILQTSESWDQICVFSHPLVDGRSSEVLGFDWNIADYVPDLVESDSTVALVFSRQADKKVAYYTSVGRDLLDLSDYRNRCIPRAEAHFARVEQGPVYTLENSK